ncbi:MAG: transporter [Leptospiraceae bacterium]|nr:transporter [Leptospiraceae bacterium]MCP5496401.1 transporter [Leptospiraceae bacterium]
MKFIIFPMLFICCTFGLFSQEEEHHKHHENKQEAQSEPNSTHTNHGEHQHDRVDSATPAGIMGMHTHPKGQWVIDYRYMGMDMNKVYYTNKPISPYQVLYGIFFNPSVQMPVTGLSLPTPGGFSGTLNLNSYRYMSAPVTMYMEMQMISAMYGLNDNLMLMIMIPYVRNAMEMVSNNFEKSNMGSKGIGDISISLTQKLYQKEIHHIYLSMGVSIPTGSIDEKDYMPMMGKSKVPYNMQPGTGTFNVLPGVGYSGSLKVLSWGLQGNFVLRSGKNKNNYRFGNRYEATTWLAWKIFDWLSASARVSYTKWDNLIGMDSELDLAMDPQNDPYKQGGKRLDVLLGFNLLLFHKLRLGMEYGKPIYQHLNGPQMATNGIINFFSQVHF